MNKRGYFGIGIYHAKTETNIGTLWRSAFQLGAAYIFTIGKRTRKQASDTCAAYRHVPMFEYECFEHFQQARPKDCPLIGIEMGGVSLECYKHPERAIYLLGAEDYGLPSVIQERCIAIVSLSAVRMPSYNVAVVGSMVMYHRTFIVNANGGQ